ncbi:MAG: ABC transporter substrate-binding protein [Methanospirillaceae archaeon]|nr:ABC transporter substrate-binding protein [Methanospirillaceae archaeon]
MYKIPVGILNLVLIAGISIAFALFWSPVSFLDPSPAKIDTLTIASGSAEYSFLTIFAEEKDFFRKYGLNVTMVTFPTGKDAVESLLAGNADCAYAAEFVGVSLLCRSPDPVVSHLAIIGSTAESEVISFAVRNDSNITRPSDLQGKRISVPLGTQAEFFLGRYLALEGIPESDLTIIGSTPAGLISQVTAGTTDAAIIWQSHVYTIRKLIPGDVTIWPAQKGQVFFWLTYTTKETIQTRPELLGRFFSALKDTEQYLILHPDEARNCLQNTLTLTPGYTDEIWNSTRFALSLDQNLLIAMEDEARWIQRENRSASKPIPLFLDTIDTGILDFVSPKSVRIIR